MKLGQNTRDLILVLVIFLSAITTIQGGSPLRLRQICGQVKCADSKKFHYKAGSVYSYRYTVNVTTSIDGGPGDESGMHLSSSIAIKFVTGCEAVLSMRNIHVWESHRGSNENKYTPNPDSPLSSGLEQFPLRFSYEDGVIHEICPDPHESILMLNVKRGLLSAFQNTMRRLDLDHFGEEDDIHGKCKVEYKLGLATASSLTIERTKDLGSCGDKFGILSTVQGTPYHFGTLHQSMPAVLSTSDCKHVVDCNLLSRISCSEVHKLQSLSRGTSGAKTSIEQNLDLTSVHDPASSTDNQETDDSLLTISTSLSASFSHLMSLDVTQSDIVVRESLQFRHNFHFGSQSNDRLRAENALRDFCLAMKEDVSKSAGDSFETLVITLRGLSGSDMTSLNDEAGRICQGDRSPFDDALEAVGTSGSVRVMKERILKGDAPPATIRSWIASLTYIPRPDSDLMEAAVEILRERVKYPEILLSFSTLAHSYCKSNSNCSSHRPIDILSRLYKKFFSHTGCVSRQNRDVEQILMYLRGIGNFGLYNLGIKEAVGRCLEVNDQAEIRVAAIESYRRMGCVPDLDSIQDIFQNPEEDSEVRIAAFLSLMRCPNYETVKAVRKMLENEEVNQVGAFVVSYLENLQETALPSKADLQGLVSDEKFSKKFGSDFRKFSRSFEISAFYDDFNFGVGLESNLIFSQKSYFPRSASLNLTVDLFGESINVLEGTLRVENFEHFLESLVGPNGKLRNKELHSIISAFREKRATPNKRRLRQLWHEFDAMRRYNSDPIASFSFKTFGNEILYKRTVGLNNSGIQNLNPFEWLNTLANQNSNFQKSQMFLDSTYIIPTGIGLPLNLTAQASVLFKMESETQFVSVQNEFKVKAKLKPSALLAVTGSMIFGTAQFQTGIKVKAHIRSSTGIDATVQIQGTEVVRAEFGLPQSQLEILEYKSELLFVQGNVSHVVGSLLEKPLICSRGFFQEIFGLKMCHSSGFHLSPNSELDNGSSPYFPLNGPAFLNVLVQKADPSLLSSKLTFVRSRNETNTRLEATYGIKSAQHTKSFGLIYDMDRINQNLTFGIRIPRNELKIEGLVEQGGSSGNLEITAVSNNVQVLGTMISFVKTGTGTTGNGKALVKPKILIKLYNSRILDANGEFSLEESSDPAGGTVIEGTGTVILSEDGSPISLKVNGIFGNRTEVNWDLEYGSESEVRGSRKHSIGWKSSLNTDPSIDTKLSLHFSQFPDYNLETFWKYQNSDDRVSSEADLVVGRGPAWSDRTSLHVRHSFETQTTFDTSDVTWVVEVTQPIYQTQWGLEGSVKSGGTFVNTTINLLYAPGKKIQSSLALESGRDGFGVEGLIQIPNEHPLTVEVSWTKRRVGVYEGKVGGNWFGRGSLSLEMNLVDRTLRQKLDKEVGLGISFGRHHPEEQIKFRCHIYSDDKESKLKLSSEHHLTNYAWELSHTYMGQGRTRHRVKTLVNAAGLDYVINLEAGLDSTGIEASVETTFNSKFPDVYAGLKVTKVFEVETIGLDYKWDVRRDQGQGFSLVLLRDSSQLNQIKYKFSLRDPPARHYVFSAETKVDADRTSQSVKGKVSWGGMDQVIFNGHMKKVQGQDSLEISAEAQTPFEHIKNPVLKTRLSCRGDPACLISIEGSWGLGGKVSGLISTHYEILSDDGDQIEPEDPDSDEGGKEVSRRRRNIRISPRTGLMTKGSDDVSPSRRFPIPPDRLGYRFCFNSSLTTTVEGWESVNINMQHTQTDPFHVKTDIDIQLPDKKTLSISNQWDWPRTWKEIWSTRVHFQAKTPFPTYQTVDLQAIIGHQDDSDRLATLGVYTDQFQYSVTIRDAQDEASYGFDLVTSIPAYDKVFGSLSYDLGESSRLACQLGWPKVLIGLETGFEWTGRWEEFHTFLTFNSPWEPLRNINTLGKIDTSEAEFKFLVNDLGLTAKSEWMVGTWDNFDLRFHSSSTIFTWRRFGIIAKQTMEEASYYSQVGAWLDDRQVGYKWEGMKGELDDEDVEGIEMKSELEIDTVVYPTVRAMTTFTRRESKYNLEASLGLREGPINLSLELHLLESYRFNERLTITTPYSRLLELEINLRPAFRPEQNLYNFGLNVKSRSDTDQMEVALVIRRGDQNILAHALTQDLEDESTDYEEGEVEPRAMVVVPMSQLIQFTSPWSRVKVIKVEFDETVESDTEDGVSDGSITDGPKFPKTIAILFSGDTAEFKFELENEIGEKTLSAGLTLPEIQSPLSLKFQSKLNLDETEKKLSVQATSHWPKKQEIQLESSYQRAQNLLKFQVDLQTPFDSWESSQASLKYEFNEVDDLKTLDLGTDSEFGQVVCNIGLSPGSFGISVLTPIEGYKSIKFQSTTLLVEDEGVESYETEILTKIENSEILLINAESELGDNNFPKTVIGTIRTTLREEQGNFAVLMRGTADELNANGQIEWSDQKVEFGLRLTLPSNKFHQLDLKVDTPFLGYEKWRLGLKTMETEEDNDEDEIEDAESSRRDLVVNVETPWSHFSPLTGTIRIATSPTSPIGLSGVKVSSTCPNATLDFSTFWILSTWNRFQIQSNTKYTHNLQFLKIPNSNLYKFKIFNFIPIPNQVKSGIRIELQDPVVRFGSSAFLHQGGNENRLDLKLESDFQNVSHYLSLTSNFTSDLRDVVGEIEIKAPSTTEVLTSSLKIHQDPTVVQGDVVFKWNDTSTLQSKFNCRFSPSSLSLERVEAQVVSKNGSESDVIGSIDATFHSPNTTKVRIEGKWIRDQDPILVDLDLSGHWGGTELQKYVDSNLIIKSPYENFPSSNFFLQGKVDHGIFGKLGGMVGTHNISMGGSWLRTEVMGSTEVNGTVDLEVSFGPIKSTELRWHSLVKPSGLAGLIKLYVNNVQHVDSTYESTSISGLATETHASKLQVRNQFWPFGITRRTSYRYTLGSENLLPTTTVQLVEVYDLVHSDLHKLGGEVRIQRTFNGREITLTGLHPLRNVSLNCRYEYLPGEYIQNVTFRWAPDSQMGYDLQMKDLTQDDKIQKRINLQVTYPVRTIRFGTGYTLDHQSGQVWTEVNLNASSVDVEGLKGIINWDTQSSPGITVRKVSGIIKHPLVPQDIRGGGEWRVTHGESVDAKISIDYSGDPKRRLTLVAKGVRGDENGLYWNLTTDMRLQHAVTNLDLKAFHSNRHLPHELSIITLIDFKNSGKVSRESKITFELFKELKKLQLMLANPDEHFDLTCQIQDRENIYHFFAQTNITGYDPSPRVEITMDTLQPHFTMTAIHGKDGSNGLYGEGGVVDARNVKLDISESYDGFRFSDVNFFLRMNHSRLVTSKLIWRPELFEELEASYVSRLEDLNEIWAHQSDKLLSSLWTDSTQVYNQVWENAKTTIEPFMEEIRQQSDFGKDSEALVQYFETALEQNDFYLDDITGLAQMFADQVSLRFSNVFINLRQYREEILGETSVTEMFEKSLLWVLEKAKNQYRVVVQAWETYTPRSYDLSAQIPFEFPDLSENFKQILYNIIDGAITTSEVVLEYVNSWASSIRSMFHHLLERHRPTISAAVHKIEVVLYQFLLGITDFIYETRDEVVKSSYYQKLTQLAQDVDDLYQDLLENDFPANTSKYYDLAVNFLQKKTNFEEIRKRFNLLCQKLNGIWSLILDFDVVQDIQNYLEEISSNVKWLAEYTHIEELTSGIILTLYEKGPELVRQTVLEANGKYEQAKTKFIFDTDKGIVDWEQKLPMPWSAFNTPPRFTELPEYQGVLKLKELFQSSRTSYLDVFKSSQSSEISWFPPFDGHAMVAGSDHFFTFDGKSYNFSGSSVYLLAGDLVEGNFTVSIDYRGLNDSLSKNARIIVSSSHNTLIIDFDTNTLRDPKRPQNVGLPIQMLHLQGYRYGESLVVQSPKGEFSVSCNLAYGLCQLRISGWHSRKVGGLLGTMDHEPRTDLIYSNGKGAQDIHDMARTWDVSNDPVVNSSSTQPIVRARADVRNESYRVAGCHRMFGSQLSGLQPCFEIVKVEPYLVMCINTVESRNNKGACLAALTYTQMCRQTGVEVVMPSACIKCDLNGETLIDRDVKVIDLTQPSFARSSDIVFIVEAKDCNKQIYVKKRLETLISTMEMDLKKARIKNNRYAVVSFGGDGVFDAPRSIVFRNQLFTDFDKLGDHFKTIHTGNSGKGSRDTFAAIEHALSLNFRPGVSKTLILFPCTTCQSKDMKMDYATLRHKLLEQTASLHILLHNDLEFHDKKLTKKFFGMDNEVVFTKADGARTGPLRGNRLLRGEATVSNKALGYCGPLALQSNGTIFSGKKLQNKKEKIIVAFSKLFSRRIAKAAEPLPCQSCSCFGKDGTGLVKCVRCDYQRQNIINPEVDVENGVEDPARNRLPATSTLLPEVKQLLEANEEDIEEISEDLVEDDYEEYPDGEVR